MDAWDAGQYSMLVQATEQDMQYFLTTHQHGTTSAQWHQTFHCKVLRGKVQAAVQYLMATEKGGVLFPEDEDPLTGTTVAEVLDSKHPPSQTPSPTLLPTYPSTCDFINLNITPDIVERVARQLHGAAGVGGADAHAVSYWLTGFGEASKILRTVVACFACWLANGFPPWAAYQALMTGRLLALDKNPGVWPIGIGDTWRWVLAKCILQVAGPAATEACGVDQLCAGLSAGIEGAVHLMQHAWDVNHASEEWGFLLIDACNAFNELNRTTML